ncbi:hypothetical protein HSX10_16130 [Winogradskyella undariae]|uniref:DUF6794 domain-containing protein n=1 Tax=Winogradskyella undariae TaxID=1285465 RepID=UPI00156B570F|nr:DUF6794 domain-containing protein [Winogradskyella undariae]NRR93105.1 hypothetical protein [Winogradskyella undariae]
MRKLIIILTILSFLSCNRKDEIPKELNYSFEYLNEVWSPENIESFKNIKENDTTPNNLHFGIGLNLRNNLLRHHAKSDSIVAYFNSLGITHYDYMSGLILYSYHQYLNGENVYIQDKVNEIIESEKPYKECMEKQRVIGLEKYNRFKISDTINVKLPVSENNSAVDYGCPNLDWKFRDSIDLSIDGIITNKYYSKDSIDAYLKVKILNKNHPKTEIMMEDLVVNDEFEIQLINSAWKIKTTGNTVYKP